MDGQPDGALAAAASPRPSALFTASRRLDVLEHYRIPYRVDEAAAGAGAHHLRAGASGPALLWPTAAADAVEPIAARFEGFGWSGIPIIARFTTDHAARAILAEWGGTWRPAGTVTSETGESVASAWQRDDGSIFLPFDPDEARLRCLSESYRPIIAPRASGLRARAMRTYYRARPLLPRPLQIELRRAYARVQIRTPFPRWPVETGLHDLLDLLLWLLESIAGEPVPRIASWPNGSSWVLVSTHDVETAVGVGAIGPVLELERSLALRSSWNFVPARYDVSPALVDDLHAEGLEVGVHGLYHDGRDLESLATLQQRLPRMREAAERWQAVGFRSPATLRNWDLMPQLGFDYDSSYPDTDPFEPQGGGCCTWLPFFNRGMVELPLTMPQDHTLFVILRQRDEATWARKIGFLRSRGGMALLDTHPDYLASATIFAAYRRLMERFAADQGVWHALPREVSSWWRRRAQSHLERAAHGWVVKGPAADNARVELTPAGTLRADSAADDDEGSG